MSDVAVSNINIQTEIDIQRVQISNVGLQVEVYIPDPVKARTITYGLIKILDSSYKRLAVIKNGIKATRTEEINGENILDFEGVLDDKLNSMIDENSVFELDDDYFDMIFFEKTLNEDGTSIVRVESEHISYRLNNPIYNVEYFTETGTPEYVLGKILEGTDFTVGSIDYINPVTYSAQEPKSRRQLLMEYVTTLNGEISFDKFAVNIVAHRGSTDLKPILKDRNVKVVSKTLNKRELDSLGNPIVSYNCEPIYLPIDTYSLGDDIILLQKSLGIVESLRVVKMSFNPYNIMETTFVFSNYVNGLENSIYRIITTNVVKDKLYNGCRIGPEFGFEAIRSDNKARAYFRSDGIHFQKGDGTGDNWTDVLYIDENGNLILDGAISWGNITDPPFIPAEYTDEQAVAAVEYTYIDENGVWTPNVYANNISVLNGKIVDAQIESVKADQITAGSIKLGDDVVVTNEDSSVYIDKNGIVITNGKMTIQNLEGTASIVDEYGVDPKFLDYFKNLVYNSSFEIFDTSNNDPKYWGGGKSDPNSNFHGDYSLKLIPGEYSMQTTNAGINPNWYGRERTRVSFYRREGQVKIEIFDITNGGTFTLTDEDGNTGSSITFENNIYWQGSRVSVSFDPDEVGHTTCEAFRIKFTNVHDTNDSYIDAVMAHPDFTGKWPQLYKDGPKSVGVKGALQQIVISDTEPTDTDVLWFDTN